MIGYWVCRRHKIGKNEYYPCCLLAVWIVEFNDWESKILRKESRRLLKLGFMGEKKE